MTPMPLEVLLVSAGIAPPSGGISHAVIGLRNALTHAGIPTEHIATSGWHRGWSRHLMVFEAIPEYRRIMGAARAGELQPLVSAHAGGPLSVARKAAYLAHARSRGSATLLHLHGPYRFDMMRYRHSLRELLFRSATDLCALTPWWVDWLRERGVRQPIHVVPNAVSSTEDHAAHHHRRMHRGPVRTVLSMSTIFPYKRVDLVVEALLELPEHVRLKIAGKGPSIEPLKQLVARHGLGERVEFLGWVEAEQRQALFQEADVFALPSELDAFGMAFAEAMAWGLPVVTLDRGPRKDVVPPHIGALVEHSDPAAIAEAIRTLDDPARRTALGQAGQARVRDHYSAAAVARSFLAAADVALARTGRHRPA